MIGVRGKRINKMRLRERASAKAARPGTRYKSGFEITLADQMTREGMNFTYEQVRLPYTIDYTYNPDFQLENGIIIEAKGLLDDNDRRKLIAVKKAYPTLDIRIVFQNANAKVRKGAKLTYAAWADKYGYKWAHKAIPQEWLNERK